MLLLILLPLGGCAVPGDQRGVTSAELDSVLLAALDGEALYTIAGGLKPLSAGFWKTSIELDAPDGEELDAMRRALQGCDDDTLSWGVQSFAKDWDGKRSCHAWVAHRPALRALLERRVDVFLPLGISPATRPAEVIAIVERQERSTRFRCYGLLFGYPEHAVEFFVQASEQSEASKEATGEAARVPRDFLSIPTVASDTGRFVYAVPKGHQPNADDLALRNVAAPILARYRALREAREDDLPAAAMDLMQDVREITVPAGYWQ